MAVPMSQASLSRPNESSGPNASCALCGSCNPRLQTIEGSPYLSRSVEGWLGGIM